MGSVVEDIQALERSLLRRGVVALEADRSSCAGCGRTPLVGECVYVYRRRTREQTLCELCRLERSEPPLATAVVRHCEHGLAVRLTAA